MISHNTGTRTLPDIYALALGRRVYISGKARVPVITNMLHSGTTKICPNLKSTSQLAYIITDTDSDCGRYF